MYFVPVHPWKYVAIHIESENFWAQGPHSVLNPYNGVEIRRLRWPLQNSNSSQLSIFWLILKYAWDHRLTESIKMVIVWYLFWVLGLLLLSCWCIVPIWLSIALVMPHERVLHKLQSLHLTFIPILSPWNYAYFLSVDKTFPKALNHTYCGNHFSMCKFKLKIIL